MTPSSLPERWSTSKASPLRGSMADGSRPRGSMGDAFPPRGSTGEASSRRGWVSTSVMGALILLSLAGVIGLISMIAAGPEPRWRWGYVAATLSFLLSAAQLAPVLSTATRLGRGYWGAGLRRMADLFGICGIVTAPVLVILMRQLPDWRGRPSIWFDWPGAPGVWDAAATLGLALAGVGLGSGAISGPPASRISRAKSQSWPGSSFSDGCDLGLMCLNWARG